MNDNQFDDLEMNLRALGRSLGASPPPVDLVRRTQLASATHLDICRTRYRQRKLVTGTVLLLAATFPIPLVFLYGDWVATSAILGHMFPPGLSGLISHVYLWIKFCALGLVYGLALPGLFWLALRARTPSTLSEAGSI